MNEKSPEILSGISILSSDSWGSEEQASVSPEVIELSVPIDGSALDVAPGLKISVTAGFWYLTGTEAAERHERLGLLRDLCKVSDVLACVVRLPPANRLDSEVAKSILCFQDDWGLDSPCPLYFEPGMLGPPSWLDPASCVVDPLWNPQDLRSDYWKVHGWHPERWVRTYPESALVSLAKQAKQLSPRFVLLAHSQRKSQYPIFKAALKKPRSNDHA